jgi:SSS family solute:Na+ symporter
VTHTGPMAIIVIYIVALFVASWWSNRLMARGGGGLLGYLMAGRQLPGWVAAALLAGLAVGGASTVGVAEQAYKAGISAGWYNAAWAAGALIMGLGVARFYRRLELTTLPELFERCYSRTARVLGTLGQIAIQVVITSLQYVAGGAILSSLMPDVFSFRTGMMVTAVVFIGITLVGGFWAAGITNVVNVTVIYGGIVVGAVLTLARVGGVGGLARQLPAGHGGFDLLAIGPGLIAGWFVVMITMAHSTQSVVQIGFATRSQADSRNAYLLGALLILPVGFLSALLGMAAAVLHPGVVATEALPRVVLDLPVLASGLVLAGLWAADVSTASALLVAGATLISTDLVKRFVAPNLSPRAESLCCRLAVVFLSAVTFLLALTVQGILKVLLVGLTLSTAYTLVVLMTIFWPAACRRSSATWTLAATMVALAAWLLAPPSWRFLPHPIYFTWMVSLLVFFAVPLFDHRPIQALDVPGR